MPNVFKTEVNVIRNSKGMTLIEIMIVLVILGGLITILGRGVISSLEKAKRNQAKVQIGEIGKSLDTYYTDCGSYPQELDALVTASGDCDNWGPDPYLKKQPKDPWNNEFIYEVDGGSYILISLGADGREGGKGNSADVSSED